MTNRSFSHDVMSAMVARNNKKSAILVVQSSPVRDELFLMQILSLYIFNKKLWLQVTWVKTFYREQFETSFSKPHE